MKELYSQILSMAQERTLYDCAPPLSLKEETLSLSFENLEVEEPLERMTAVSFIAICMHSLSSLFGSSLTIKRRAPVWSGSGPRFHDASPCAEFVVSRHCCSLHTLIIGLVNHDAVQAGRERLSPSKGSQPKELVKTQRLDNPAALYNYYPMELSPPFITIYFQPFKIFMNEMAMPTEEGEYSADELSYARDYTSITLRKYVIEGELQKALRSIHGADFWRPSVVQKGDTKKSFYPDAAWYLHLEHFGADVLVRFGEIRNFTSTGDPTAQSQIDYHATVTTKAVCSSSVSSGTKLTWST